MMGAEEPREGTPEVGRDEAAIAEVSPSPPENKGAKE
jgi:hypothetical protein